MIINPHARENIWITHEKADSTYYYTWVHSPIYDILLYLLYIETPNSGNNNKKTVIIITIMNYVCNDRPAWNQLRWTLVPFQSKRWSVWEVVGTVFLVDKPWLTAIEYRTILGYRHASVSLRIYTKEKLTDLAFISIVYFNII